MSDTRHQERVVRDAFQYAVGDLARQPEPRDWWRADRHHAFYGRLVGMTLAPGQHNAALDRALTPAKTLARLVLSQYRPLIQCPLEASYRETEAEARTNPLQAKALIAPTKDNLLKTLEAALDQRVELDRLIHSLAHAIGQLDAAKDNLWRAA